MFCLLQLHRSAQAVGEYALLISLYYSVLLGQPAEIRSDKYLVCHWGGVSFQRRLKKKMEAAPERQGFLFKQAIFFLP